MRYFTQPQLIHAARIAEQRGYPRQLNVEMLNRHTRPSDTFPVSSFLPRQHAAGKSAPTPVRCIISIAGGGLHQIDTDLELFQSLPNVATVDEMLAAGYDPRRTEDNEEAEDLG